MGHEKLNPKYVCSENQCICISAIWSGQVCDALQCWDQIKLFWSSSKDNTRLWEPYSMEFLHCFLIVLTPWLSAKFKVICIQCHGPVNRKHNVMWPPVEGERNAWPTIPLGSFLPPLTGRFYLCQPPVLTRITPLTTSSCEHFQGQLYPFLF